MNLETPKLLFKYLINYGGDRRPHARRLFYLLARRFTPVVAAAGGPATYFVSTADDGIGWEVFLLGSFDREQVETVYGVLRECGQADFAGKTFLDVGANIGTNAISAVLERGFARAVAFEPGPENFRLLRHNILANGLEDRVRAFELALSDADGEVSLEINPASPGTNQIRGPDEGAGMPSPLRTVPVKTTTFDALAENGELRPEEIGLAWIDTQGHEAQVLRGAQSLIRSRVPVVMEFWPEGLRLMGGPEAMEAMVVEHYTHIVDIRKADIARGDFLLPASAIRSLTAEYRGSDYTDLLLLKL